MAQPATYTGEVEDCSGFLLQCSLYFEMQPQLFSTECARIAFMIYLLSGRALQWGQSNSHSNGPVTSSLASFTNHFKEVFGQTASVLYIHDQLFNLRQGNTSINAYALQFRTLAASSGWNEMALLTAFRQGFNPEVRHQGHI